MARRWSPMRFWLTLVEPRARRRTQSDKASSGITSRPFSPCQLVIMRFPCTVSKAGIPALGGVLCTFLRHNAEPARSQVPSRGTFCRQPSSVKSGYRTSHQNHQSQGDANVDSAACRPTPAVSAPLRPRAHRQPDGRGRLCRGNPRDPRQRAGDDRARRTNVKVELFRVFTRIWNSLSVNGRSELIQRDLPAEVRLGQITPLPRQAFLLSCLEGFSEEEAAAILAVDVPTVRDLVDEAGRELAADMATDILIIEDEPLIAMDLEALVEGLGHNVLGVARTRTEAVKLAGEQAPGPDPGRHPARRRQLRARRRERPPQDLRGAGDLHHRLSGALPHRRAAGAGLPDRQAVPAGERLGGDQPGAVLPAERQAPRGARHGLSRPTYAVTRKAPPRRGFF